MENILTKQELELLQKAIDKLMDEEFVAMLRHNKAHRIEAVLEGGDRCRSLVQISKKLQSISEK